MNTFSVITPPKSPQFDNLCEYPFLENFSEEYLELNDRVETLCSCVNEENAIGAFKLYVKPIVHSCDFCFPDNFSTLWGLLSRLKYDSTNIKVIRSKINKLLLDIYACYDHVEGQQLAEFIKRFVFLIKGIYIICSSDVLNRLFISHIRLDILTIFLKLLESSKPTSERYIREAMELHPSDTNPKEYVLEALFDILVDDKLAPTQSLCSCYSVIWILLIQHYEQTANGWFKYLHKKVIQLQSGKSKSFEGFLDTLRPNLSLPKSASSIEMDKLWCLYWAILTTTAPLHKDFSDFLGTSEIATSDITRKFATSLWILRNQFLGDTMPSEESSQRALKALLHLQTVWGPSREVLCLLWRHFSKLLGTVPEVVSHSENQESDCHSFFIFSRMALFTFLAHPSEFLDIVRLPIYSLTQTGVNNYLSFFELLLHNISNDSRNLNFGFTLLVDFLVSVFEQQVGDEQKYWSSEREIGCRWAALRCLQRILLVLYEKKITLSKSLEKLIQISSQLRSTLMQHKSKSLQVVANTGTLATIGWHKDLCLLSVSFCRSLVSSQNADLTSYQWRFLSLVLDGCLIESLSNATDSDDWLVVLERLLRALSLQREICPESLSARIWTDLLTAFVSRGCIVPEWADKCAEIAFLFISLASRNAGSIPAVCNSTERWADVRNLVSQFTFTTTVSPAFRRLFLRRLFTEEDLLASILHTMAHPTVAVDDAWQVYAAWLTYRLRYDDDRDSRDHRAYMSCTTKSSILQSLCPKDVYDCITSTDAKMSLLRLSERFEALETFQGRMQFKELIHRHLSPLAQLLCSTVEQACSLPMHFSASDIMSAYHATALLMESCAGLLYTANGPFMRLFSHVLLPPWRKLGKNNREIQEVLVACIEENLEAFITGIAQLNVFKDPFIVRLLRDFLRFILFTVSTRSIATAVRVCLISSFRAHLLNILAQEFIATTKNPTSLGSDRRENRPQHWQECAEKWLNFVKEMQHGASTPPQSMQDMPYLLWPLGGLLTEKPNVSLFPSLAKRCVDVFSEFAVQFERKDAAPLRLETVNIFRKIYESASLETKSVLAIHLPKAIIAKIDPSPKDNATNVRSTNVFF